jgi:HEPN domain-containing protein
MEKNAEDYRQAALERIEQARANYDRKAYALAMYVAGVAVECMLRAYIIRRKGRGQLETGHNISLLVYESGLKAIALEETQKQGASVAVIDRYIEEFGDRSSTINLGWSNDYRYVSEARLRAHLRKIKLLPKVKGDVLKASANRLIEAARWIVQEGERLWNHSERKWARSCGADFARPPSCA